MTAMQQHLMAMKKAEMQDAAFRLGMDPIGRNARKAEWAAYIENSMDEYGVNLRMMLTLEEVEALNTQMAESMRLPRDISEHGSEELLNALMTLEDVGLVTCADSAWQLDERLPAWLTLDEADRAQLHMQDLLYAYMQGWLLHVGMMPVQELTTRAAALLDVDEEEVQAEAQMLCTALLQARDGIVGFFTSEDGVIWAVSSELEEPQHLWERLQVPVIAALEYPAFDEDSLVFAAREALVPGDVKLYLPLVNELERRGIEDADALVDDAVMLVENEQPDEAQQMILDEVQPRNINDAHKLMTMFNDLCNTLPRWANKGHAPVTLIRQMQRRTASIPGRNDPCPCGSGRKYKQCCGKRVN
ncbi:MAG: SEC-C domain-containing protein [Clostridia bacterium]|nr:SEC-C domain-containing protein [Clostridia bacterium]